jgi:hypothetical protein
MLQAVWDFEEEALHERSTGKVSMMGLLGLDGPVSQGDSSYVRRVAHDVAAVVLKVCLKKGPWMAMSVQGVLEVQLAVERVPGVSAARFELVDLEQLENFPWAQTAVFLRLEVSLRNLESAPQASLAQNHTKVALTCRL